MTDSQPRVALLDNSTITGVQRLLGAIPVKNTVVLDMDILCLETLVQSILFYDEIVVVDDYKTEHRVGRQTDFPFLRLLAPDELGYPQIVTAAQGLMAEVTPRVEAGEITDDDFRPFFDLLSMNMLFTWDMAGSEYFLTYKMLAGAGGVDLEKYSRLASGIHDELIGKRFNGQRRPRLSRPELIDSAGAPVDEDYSVVDNQGGAHSPKLSKQVSAFFSGLSWLAYRTSFYSLVAKSLNSDLLLHPIRHSFHISLLSKVGRANHVGLQPLIDAMNDRANDTLNRVVHAAQPFVTTTRTPLYVTWLAKQEGDPSRIVAAAMRLRDDNRFVHARQQLSALTQLMDADDKRFAKEANKIVRAVDRALDAIKVEFAVTTQQGPSLSNAITLWNTVALASQLPPVPSLSIRIPPLTFLNNLKPTRGFVSVYRSVVRDLASVARLGQYHDVLTSRATLERDATEYLSKTEELGYRYAKSDWKIPM